MKIITKLIILALLVQACSNTDKKYTESILSDEIIKAVMTDSTSINDFAKICKCWGFVKYFYPNIEESGVNIDYELFELLDNYASSLNSNEVISSWIDSIENRHIRKRTRKTPIEITSYSSCNLEWIEDDQYLGSKLSASMKSILAYRRQKGNYSIQDESGVIHHAAANNSNGQLNELDNLKQRLLLLFSYWNTIEYYYCLKQEDLHWHDLLKQYLPAFISSSKYECLEQLKLLASRLHDGHGVIWTPEDSTPSVIPINVRIEDSLMVTIGNCDSLFPIGSRILSIDGKSPSDIMRKLKDTSHTNYSNIASLKQAITTKGLYTYQDSSYIIMNSGDNIYAVKLRALGIDEYIVWEKQHRSSYIPDCQLMDSICYINAGAYVSSKISEYVKMIQNATTIIFDLRFYPNEVMLPFINLCFVPNETAFVTFMLPKWNEPGSVEFITPINQVAKTIYNGRVIILVDENTCSQGEYTAMALQAYPNAITVGSMTGGYDGDMTSISLPGGIYAFYTSMGVLYPDGGVTQRYGVRIDYELEPSIVDTMYYNPSSLSRYIFTVIEN